MTGTKEKHRKNRRYGPTKARTVKKLSLFLFFGLCERVPIAAILLSLFDVFGEVSRLGVQGILGGLGPV